MSHTADLLRNLVVIFLSAGFVLHLCHRLRIPSTVGLILTGVILGPSASGLLADPKQIEGLADIGIMLLMFSIGLDFTRERLMEFRKAVVLGFVQMGICIVGTAVVALPFVAHWGQAVFMGFLVAHTSSTLMLKLAIDRGEVESPQVRIGLGISICQDLSVVPMILILPMLSGEGVSFLVVAWQLGSAGAVLLVALALARWVIPFWLHHVIHTRSRELFLIFLIVVCLGTAWATAAVGLSLALGAFLAGLAIAGSEYSHQTMAEVVPFRDLLISLFFISIGTLMDLATIPAVAGVALLLVIGVLLLKFISGLVPVLQGGYPLRIAVLAGLAMAQIGEFSFVLVLLGKGGDNPLIDQSFYQLFMVTAVVTLLLNPLLFASGPHVAGWFEKVPLLQRYRDRQLATPQEPVPTLDNHVIIAGYGLTGMNLVRALKMLMVPHVVLELNPNTVRRAQRNQEPILYGDSTRVEVLRKAQIDHARVLVVAISDPRAVRQTVQVARHENPAVHILVRTRFMKDMEILLQLGANEVVPEEFETSLEILARTLLQYHLPRRTIEEIEQHFRLNTYQMLRTAGPMPPDQSLLGEILPGLSIEAVEVVSGSPAVGRSLLELQLPNRTGAMVLAIRRAGKLETVPAADFQVHDKDVLIIAGTPLQVTRAMRYLVPPTA